MTLSLALTNIANDTFSFGPWILGKISGPKISEVRYDSLENLNKEALSGKGADLIKVSFNAVPRLLKDYTILPSGAAIVRGAGPKLVAKESSLDFTSSTIAIPGKESTAWLLAKSLLPQFKNVIELPYGEILDSVNSGKADCGLLIHESSFEIEKKGFKEVAQLFELWSERTGGLPLPLGGLLAKKSLGEEMIQEISATLQHSIEHAKAHPKEVMDFVRELSPVKDISVIEKSVHFWVNDESVSMSYEGRKAVDILVEMAGYS